jgi:hypothetical protein
MDAAGCRSNEIAYAPIAWLNGEASADACAARPDADRAASESHGLHGLGGTSPSLTETGTIRPSVVMRPIMTGL